ncbi:MAG: PulJ/GspJ family protein [Candidatus Xenobia bacterium]
MRPNRAAGGMTLVEILISIFVFALFTTLMATAIVTAYKNQVGMDARTQAFRQALVGMDKMEAELSTCQQVYAPDPTSVFTEGATINPSPSQPFRFVYVPSAPLVPNTPYVAPSPVQVSYELTPDNRLERFLYDTNGTPMAQLVSSPVLDFSVTRVARANAEELLCISALAHVPTHDPNNPAPLFFEMQVPCIAPNQ